MSFGAALRAGFANAISLAPGTLLVFLTRALERIAAVLVFAWLAMGGEPLLAAGLGVVLFGAAVVRTLILGASLAQGRVRLRGLIRGGLIHEGEAVVHRVLPFVVLDLAISLFVRLWTGFAWVSGGVAFFASSDVVGPSVLLALAVFLSPLLVIATRIWTELAFARSINRNEPASVSLYESVRAIALRPVAIWLLTVIAAVVCEAAVSGVAGSLANPWDPRAPAFLALLAQVVAGALAAFIPSVLEVTRLHAFLALDLDATGELPRPPEPVPVAPIVSAV